MVDTLPPTPDTAPVPSAKSPADIARAEIAKGRRDSKKLKSLIAGAKANSATKYLRGPVLDANRITALCKQFDELDDHDAAALLQSQPGISLATLQRQAETRVASVRLGSRVLVAVLSTWQPRPLAVLRAGRWRQRPRG